MTSIMLKVTGAQAWAAVTGPLTSGMVGIPVTVEYDGAWEGLTKNLVCRCSEWGSEDGEHRTILNVGTTATVAHEVMQAGRYLFLGIEGISPDGKLVIPTTWAMCGSIQPGANTGSDLSADPTLPVWEQLRAEMETIKEGAVSEDQLTEIRACTESAVQAANVAARVVDETFRASQSAAVSAGRAETAAQLAEEAASSVGDRQEIVRAVLEALPTWTGGDY